jgi:DNA-binding transcriptional ArsR family regulator
MNECCQTTEEINDFLESKDMELLSSLYKMFSDPNRLKIIIALTKRELCVHDLTELLGMTQSNVSHQLRLLKANRLVKVRKEGKYSHYSLDDEHIDMIIKMGIDHIEHG